MLSWYLYQTDINSWDVKQEKIAVEYGENVSFQLADLVDVETYTNVTADNFAYVIEKMVELKEVRQSVISKHRNHINKNDF